MADATGETKEPLRVAFDRRIKLEFHGAKITSDGGLLAYGELDDALGLTTVAASALAEGRRGKNIRHRLLGLLRQAVYGRLAGYEDVNDAARLACNPAMRAIVGREGLDRPAASTSQMGRFETEWLATEANLAALAALSGAWIDRVHARRPPDGIILDMDSSESPTHGQQEGSAWNGHFRRACYHPLFVFNQFGDLERCALRPGNVHSADDWRSVLAPVIARYRGRGLTLYFRGDAAFAKPELYELLEAEGIGYAIRLPANRVLQERIGHLLTRPVGRPPKKPQVFHASFTYQAQSWTKPRRVVTKVEWHQGELYPRVGFIVTNLRRPAERIQQVLQWSGHGGAVDQGREAGTPLDPTVLSRLPGQRGPAATVRARLQPGQLPAQPRAARRRGAVVADHAAGEAHQDRCQDRAPRPLPRVPAGRGGGAARPVRRDPAPDRPPARTPRCGGLTGANHGGGRSRGENHAPRSTAGTRVARFRLWARLQRLLSPEISRWARPSVDRESVKEHGSRRWPRSSGGSGIRTGSAPTFWRSSSPEPDTQEETTMSDPKLQLLTPNNAQVIFIDHQPQMAFGVQSIDRQVLKNNTVALAKAAKVFQIPVTITTVETESFSGHTYPELLAVFPEQPILERTSMNSWDDQKVRDALEKNGRHKVVVSGLWTEVCNNSFALSAMEGAGYEIYMVADASGATSKEAQDYAMLRMIQAGVVPVTWQQVLLEWQRDWARKETYDAVMSIVKEHSGAYGMGVDYAYTMVHKAPERVKHGPTLEPVPAGNAAS